MKSNPHIIIFKVFPVIGFDIILHNQDIIVEFEETDRLMR